MHRCHRSGGDGSSRQTVLAADVGVCVNSSKSPSDVRHSAVTRCTPLDRRASTASAIIMLSPRTMAAVPVSLGRLLVTGISSSPTSTATTKVGISGPHRLITPARLAPTNVPPNPIHRYVGAGTRIGSQARPGGKKCWYTPIAVAPIPTVRTINQAARPFSQRSRQDTSQPSAFMSRMIRYRAQRPVFEHVRAITRLIWRFERTPCDFLLVERVLPEIHDPCDASYFRDVGSVTPGCP